MAPKFKNTYIVVVALCENNAQSLEILLELNKTLTSPQRVFGGELKADTADREAAL